MLIHKTEKLNQLINHHHLFFLSFSSPFLVLLISLLAASGFPLVWKAVMFISHSSLSSAVLPTWAPVTCSRVIPHNSQFPSNIISAQAGMFMVGKVARGPRRLQGASQPQRSLSLSCFSLWGGEEKGNMSVHFPLYESVPSALVMSYTLLSADNGSHHSACFSVSVKLGYCSYVPPASLQTSYYDICFFGHLSPGSVIFCHPMPCG